MKISPSPLLLLYTPTQPSRERLWGTSQRPHNAQTGRQSLRAREVQKDHGVRSQVPVKTKIFSSPILHRSNGPVRKISRHTVDCWSNCTRGQCTEEVSDSPASIDTPGQGSLVKSFKDKFWNLEISSHGLVMFILHGKTVTIGQPSRSQHSVKLGCLL